MTRLVLVRHGNTFESGETPVMVGRNEDLPLTSDGLRQGEAAGNFIATFGLNQPTLLYSPLRRTTQTAKLIENALVGKIASAQVEPRLLEIDYGKWAGLSREQIIDRFDAKEFEAWEKFSEWPRTAGFQPDENALKLLARTLAKEAQSRAGDTIIVSSNGVLRYFLGLIPGEFERRVAAGQFKMRTGAVSVMQLREEAWTIEKWDQR